MEGPIAKTVSAVLDFWFGLSEVGGPIEFR